MKSNIDDHCITSLKSLKFDKSHRYLVFKVQDERVVLPLPSRSSSVRANEESHGIPS